MKRLEVIIESFNTNGSIYMTVKNDTDSFIYDENIAEFLGITPNKYHDLMKQQCKFHIPKDQSEMYFDDFKEAGKAKKWLDENIEYYLVMKELSPLVIGE